MTTERNSLETDTLINDDLPFANRKQELNDLRASENNSYIFIYAPAGMGKTRLMKAMERDLQDQHQNTELAWFTAWICFDREEEAKSSPLAVLKALIRSTDPAAVPPELLEEQNDEEQIESLITQFLEIATKGNRRRLALFLDALGSAKPEVIDFLESDLIPNLSGRATVSSLRVFASARWPLSATAGKTGLAWRPMPLSPFRHRDICDVLSLHLNNPGVESVKQEAIAWQLLELCRGHPRSVSNILKRVGKHPRLDGKNRLTNHKVLFERVVKPAIQDEIVNTAKRESEIDDRALQSIFTLRVASPSFLGACLRDDPDLATYELHKRGKSNELYNKLGNTRLMDESYNQANKFGLALDPVVRHFFSMSLVYEDKPRHQRLHERAFRYYEGQLSKHENTSWLAGADQLMTATEALYHACCLLLTFEPPVQQNLTELIARIDAWREWWQCGNIDVDRFAREWIARIRDDQDLPLLLRMLLGESGYETLLGYIATSVKCAEQPDTEEEEL